LLVKLVSSRDFNQDVSHAKRAARLEPVFITDRGKPTHVLLSIDAFREMSGDGETLVDLLAMPGIGELDGTIGVGAWDRRVGLE
jgi:prevent-host-death family protein